MPVTETREPAFMHGNDYHAHPAYSKSRLATFAESRRMYEAVHVTGAIAQQQTAAQSLGSLAHAAILEPDTLEGDFIRIPEDVLSKSGSKAGKAWKEFEAEHEGQLLLKSKEWETVEAIVKSVQCSDIARLLYAGGSITEGSWFYTDEETALECKFRPDVLVELPDCVMVFDPKVTTLGVSPKKFRHQIKKFRYWLSVAHTSAGVQELFGKPCIYHFVVVSADPPHTCTVHRLLDSTVLESMDRRREILADLRRCIESGDWSEPWEHEVNEQNLTKEEMY